MERKQKESELGLCGVDPSKVKGDFVDFRQLAYGNTYLKDASIKEFLVLKGI